ncbi:MAG TPA: hypothetical protein VHK22_03930 [Gaiellaceae bacterium]|jgi:hypothetical protein|nr:hypothetical protein [Gaiellaceae bacterium]
MNSAGANGGAWAMTHDNWMRWAAAGAGFLGIGLGVMLGGLVARAGDLVFLGGVLAGTQAACLLTLAAIHRFSGLR